MKYWKTFAACLIVCLISSSAFAQEIYRSSDAFGSFTGDCLAIIEGNCVYRSSGRLCYREQAQFVVDGDAVFKANAGFCNSKAACQYIWQDGGFYRSDDFAGNFLGDLLFIVEGKRIFEARNGRFKGDCLYILEQNKVFRSGNSFGSRRDDCVLVVKNGRVSLPVLLAVLASPL